jgi:YgiT-type zinc finger domain-containing protein
MRVDLTRPVEGIRRRGNRLTAGQQPGSVKPPGRGSQDRETTMICHNCGGELESLITNLPFTVDHNSIVIIKGLPVLQCRNGGEYLIDDAVMEKVDSILTRIDKTTVLEVLSYAATA